jgi:hypothetical protein
MGTSLKQNMPRFGAACTRIIDQAKIIVAAARVGAGAGVARVAGRKWTSEAS